MAIQKITAATLSKTFGGSIRYWADKRKMLIKAGLLNKIGGLYFGDLHAIERVIAEGSKRVWGN
jgi:hypothetical protein